MRTNIKNLAPCFYPWGFVYLHLRLSPVCFPSNAGASGGRVKDRSNIMTVTSEHRKALTELRGSDLCSRAEFMFCQWTNTITSIACSISATFIFSLGCVEKSGHRWLRCLSSGCRDMLFCKTAIRMIFKSFLSTRCSGLKRKLESDTFCCLKFTVHTLKPSNPANWNLVLRSG